MKEKVHKTISAICPLFICDLPSYWEPRRWYWDPKRLSKHPVRESSPPLRPQVSIFNCAPQVEANPLFYQALALGRWAHGGGGGWVGSHQRSRQSSPGVSILPSTSSNTNWCFSFW